VLRVAAARVAMRLMSWLPGSMAQSSSAALPEIIQMMFGPTA